MQRQHFIIKRLMTYSPAILVAVSIVVLTLYLDQLRFNTQLQALRHSIFNELSVVRAKIEGNINSNAHLIKGLVVAISTEPDITSKRFNALAKPIFQENSEIKNIAAAPNLIIKYMYPLKGNEAAVGLNYRTIPTQYRAVQKAIAVNKLTIAGPVNLVQGGKGFIARVPVFTESEKGEPRLWGLLSAVIDSEKLYAHSNLKESQTDLDIAIRGKDGLGEEGDVFYGDSNILTSSPVLIEVTLPYGSWQLAAVPKGGWPVQATDRPTFFLIVLVVSFCVLIPLIILGRFLEKRRESEELLNGLFELSPIGIALNDYETGVFARINSALLEPTGYSKEEFCNLSYWDLTPEEYKKQEEKQLVSLEKYNRYGPYEKEYIRKDGSRYPVLLNGIVVHAMSGKKMIWSIIEDISERKKNEKIKSEFISMVSHELRTPLTSISGALGLVLAGVVGDITDETRKLLDVAKTNSERLSFLINDLLDMEKLFAQKMNFDMQQHDLVKQVQSSITNNQSYADKYHIDIKFSSEVNKVLVNVDSQRLQQVLANLISNAVKFSPSNGHVDIRIKMMADYVRVEVSDYGKGVPKEFYKDIFKKFAQADSSDTREKGGTGLGLSISQEMIIQMRGKIGFDSVEGQGSTFYIDLPIVHES